MDILKIQRFVHNDPNLQRGEMSWQKTRHAIGGFSLFITSLLERASMQDGSFTYQWNQEEKDYYQILRINPGTNKVVDKRRIRFDKIVRLPDWGLFGYGHKNLHLLPDNPLKEMFEDSNLDVMLFNPVPVDGYGQPRYHRWFALFLDIDDLEISSDELLSNLNTNRDDIDSYLRPRLESPLWERICEKYRGDEELLRFIYYDTLWYHTGRSIHFVAYDRWMNQGYEDDPDTKALKEMFPFMFEEEEPDYEDEAWEGEKVQSLRARLQADPNQTIHPTMKVRLAGSINPKTGDIALGFFHPYALPYYQPFADDLYARAFDRWGIASFEDHDARPAIGHPEDVITNKKPSMFFPQLSKQETNKADDDDDGIDYDPFADDRVIRHPRDNHSSKGESGKDRSVNRCPRSTQSISDTSQHGQSPLRGDWGSPCSPQRGEQYNDGAERYDDADDFYYDPFAGEDPYKRPDNDSSSSSTPGSPSLLDRYSASGLCSIRPQVEDSNDDDDEIDYDPFDDDWWRRQEEKEMALKSRDDDSGDDDPDGPGGSSAGGLFSVGGVESGSLSEVDDYPVEDVHEDLDEDVVEETDEEMRFLERKPINTLMAGETLHYRLVKWKGKVRRVLGEEDKRSVGKFIAEHRMNLMEILRNEGEDAFYGSKVIDLDHYAKLLRKFLVKEEESEHRPAVVTVWRWEIAFGAEPFGRSIAKRLGLEEHLKVSEGSAILDGVYSLQLPSFLSGRQMQYKRNFKSFELRLYRIDIVETRLNEMRIVSAQELEKGLGIDEMVELEWGILKHLRSSNRLSDLLAYIWLNHRKRMVFKDGVVSRDEAMHYLMNELGWSASHTRAILRRLVNLQWITPVQRGYIVHSWSHVARGMGVQCERLVLVSKDELKSVKGLKSVAASLPGTFGEPLIKFEIAKVLSVSVHTVKRNRSGRCREWFRNRYYKSFESRQQAEEARVKELHPKHRWPLCLCGYKMLPTKLGESSWALERSSAARILDLTTLYLIGKSRRLRKATSNLTQTGDGVRERGVISWQMVDCERYTNFENNSNSLVSSLEKSKSKPSTLKVGSAFRPRNGKTSMAWSCSVKSGGKISARSLYC